MHHIHRFHSSTARLHHRSVRCSASPLSIQRRRRRRGLEEFRQREFIGFPFLSLADALELEDSVGSQDEVEDLMQRLSTNLVDDRIQRIQSVVSNRTYSVLPIVENLYDMGNLSAVIRSADAFGFGAVHSIHPDLNYKQSARTSGGSDKWLDVRVWQPQPEGGESATRSCLTSIKKAGYRIIVTHLRKGALDIGKIDWTQKTAFVLGNEKCGVSDEAVELADDCAIIPMAGFVESFNISVAAALIMYTAQQQRIAKLGSSGDLLADEKKMLTAALMLRSVREGPTLIRELLNRPPHKWQSVDQRES